MRHTYGGGYRMSLSPLLPTEGQNRLHPTLGKCYQRVFRFRESPVDLIKIYHQPYYKQLLKLMNEQQRTKWSMTYKIIITLLSSLAGILGLTSCATGDVTGMTAAASCATTAFLLKGSMA